MGKVWLVWAHVLLLCAREAKEGLPDQVQELLWPDADPSPWPEVGPEAEDPFDVGVVCRYRRKT